MYYTTPHHLNLEMSILLHHAGATTDRITSRNMPAAQAANPVLCPEFFTAI